MLSEVWGDMERLEWRGGMWRKVDRLKVDVD